MFRIVQGSTPTVLIDVDPSWTVEAVLVSLTQHGSVVKAYRIGDDQVVVASGSVSCRFEQADTLALDPRYEAAINVAIRLDDDVRPNIQPMPVAVVPFTPEEVI